MLMLWKSKLGYGVSHAVIITVYTLHKVILADHDIYLVHEFQVKLLRKLRKL